MVIDQLVAQARVPEPTVARSTATPRAYTGFERSEPGRGDTQGSEGERTASGIVIGPPLVVDPVLHAAADLADPMGGRDFETVDAAAAELASRRPVVRIGPPLVPREAVGEAVVSRGRSAVRSEPAPAQAPSRPDVTRVGASDVAGPAVRPSAAVQRGHAIEPEPSIGSTTAPTRRVQAEPLDRGAMLDEPLGLTLEPASLASEGDGPARREPTHSPLVPMAAPQLGDARTPSSSAPLSMQAERVASSTLVVPASDERASPESLARTAGAPIHERPDPMRARPREGEPAALETRGHDRGTSSLEHRSDDRAPRSELHDDASEPTRALRESPAIPRAMEVPQPEHPWAIEVPQPEHPEPRQRPTAENEPRDDPRTALPTSPATRAEDQPEHTTEPAAADARPRRGSGEPVVEGLARARAAEDDAEAPRSLPETIAQARAALDPSQPRVASEQPQRTRVVQVHVGRVVVRAPAPAVRSEPRPSPAPRMSLHDYLSRRNGGSR